MKLPATKQAFVLHFGEMGSRWGINRTVGQIYAVLYLSDAPMNAEQITDALGVSRSNVSMGLKELQAWRLVRITVSAQPVAAERPGTGYQVLYLAQGVASQG